MGASDAIGLVTNMVPMDRNRGLHDDRGVLLPTESKTRWEVRDTPAPARTPLAVFVHTPRACRADTMEPPHSLPKSQLQKEPKSFCS